MSWRPGRFGTDRDGYRQLLAAGRRWPDRLWAVEGCAGVGRHLAQRLVADGEPVVDVPAKLSARARVFSTGQGRKTDATDAHSIALVGTRMAGLRPVVDDQQLAVLRVLADRRRALGEDHTRMVAQLHHLLLELIPGGAKKDLSAAQAKALPAKVRPRDLAGKTRRRVAAELIADLERIYARKKAADKELRELITDTGTSLLTLNGIGPSGAGRLLVLTDVPAVTTDFGTPYAALLSRGSLDELAGMSFPAGSMAPRSRAAAGSSPPLAGRPRSAR